MFFTIVHMNHDSTCCFHIAYNFSGIILVEVTFIVKIIYTDKFSILNIAYFKANRAKKFFDALKIITVWCKPVHVATIR